MLAGTLMVQGCTSDAGKSTLVAALGRVLARRGVSVAPFKPQNMSLNSAVTAAGGEIGRAQALQAQACGVAPHTDMNPVLLKPSSDTGAQVIVQGRAIGHLGALDYHAYKAQARRAVMESFARLRERHGHIVVEGAGSPAEINLRAGDIANMGFAEEADCPVILIADIDKGGVFAHLVGTLELLSPSEQARVVGFVINKFRGDLALLQPGLDWLEARTGKPVLGVLPYLHDFFLDAEDGLANVQRAPGDGALTAVVPVLPRISNHTDFDPLRLHPQVNFSFVSAREPPPPCDLIILPGSKHVQADLAALRDGGWPAAIARHLRYGGKLMGICGGLQMLGATVQDPDGVEGGQAECAGLGWLPLHTRMGANKTLRQRRGRLQLVAGAAAVEVTGYEIHHGVSRSDAPLHQPIAFDDGPEGYCSDDGAILATYLHGVFEQPGALQHILDWAGLAGAEAQDGAALREAQLERLADCAEAHLDLHRLFAIMQIQCL